MSESQSIRQCIACNAVLSRTASDPQLRRKYCNPVCYHAARGKRTSLSERFWARVDRTSAPDGCWPWTGPPGYHGYGDVGRGRRSEGHAHAHRIAYELTHGPIPDKLYVCHRCDNRICCNPAHLFLGTHEDNQRDKVSKGRMTRGENQWRSELTDEKVRQIRARYASSGESQAELAAAFGVCRGTIEHVVQGLTWKHVT